MPQDNHSLMQLYLDGLKNNFFTFFFVHDNNSTRIDKNNLMNSHNYLKNKNINQILFAQKLQSLFFKKKKFLLEVLKLKKGMRKPWRTFLFFYS